MWKFRLQIPNQHFNLICWDSLVEDDFDAGRSIDRLVDAAFLYYSTGCACLQKYARYIPHRLGLLCYFHVLLSYLSVAIATLIMFDLLVLAFMVCAIGRSARDMRPFGGMRAWALS